MKIIKESKVRPPKKYGLNLNEDTFDKVKSIDADDIPVETKPAPEIGPKFGLASMLNTAIQDEWKTIDMYNSLSVTASTEGYDDIARIIDEINTEESKHVGQLQAALKTVAPNAKAIEAGEQEGENQLGSAEI